jgi:Bacterial SH3 domain
VAPRLIANRYQLLREVSREPDTTFWQAADTLLDRDVMLELLRPELADDPVAVAQFRDSLRVTARLGATAHGRLLDGGTDPEQQLPFAVFEWDDSRPSPPPPIEAPPPAPQKRAKTARTTSRNVALPVLLTLVPVAVGIIAVAKLLSPSGQSVAQVFAIPTGTVLVGNQVVTPPPALATSTSRAVVAASAAPSPRAVTPTPTGERVAIANTDGIGVALRDSPGGQRLPGKGYDEGVTVTVLERQGEWAHIRGDDGREGWVLAVTVPPSR